MTAGDGWKINLPGVITTLTSVETAATDLGAAFDPLADTLTAIFTASGDAASIAVEVQSILDDQMTNVSNASSRIIAAVTGAATAAATYDGGDSEMAATIQAEAVKASENGDLSFFEGGK